MNARFALEREAVPCGQGARKWIPFTKVLTLALVGSPLAMGCSAQDDAATDSASSSDAVTETRIGNASGGKRKDRHESEEARNTVAFHMVDFVGWNNRDWGVMRHYHAPDVKVLWAGEMMQGVEQHIADMQELLTAFPDSRILLHTPAVAQGDWTCIVGVAPGSGSRMATVARWHDGAISEEYLFAAEVPAGQAKPTVSGPRLVSIENTDETSAEVAGARPGWSCTMDGERGPNMVATLTHRTAGKADETMTFVPTFGGG